MAVTRGQEVVSFDADSAVEAVRAETDATLFLAAEYNLEDRNSLHIHDDFAAQFDSVDEREAHLDRVYRYLNLDLVETDVYADLFDQSRVRSFVAYTEDLVVVRVLTADQEGLCLLLSPGAPVTAVVEAVESTL
jgi:hypothetical protein